MHITHVHATRDNNREYDKQCDKKSKTNNEAHMGNKQAEIYLKSLGVNLILQVMKSTFCSQVRSFRPVRL